MLCAALSSGADIARLGVRMPEVVGVVVAHLSPSRWLDLSCLVQVHFFFFFRGVRLLVQEVRAGGIPSIRAR